MTIYETAIKGNKRSVALAASTDDLIAVGS